MDILVKSFLGVARASLSIDPGQIVLVTGNNAAGKTSVLTPIALTLARQPCAIDDVAGLNRFKRVFLKRDMNVYVKEGEQEATCVIQEGDERVTLTWPDAEVTATGGAPYGNIVAAGLAKFGRISSAARRAILIEVLQASPTFEDVQAELSDANWSEKNISGIWDVIQKNGWDGAGDLATKALAEARGAWQQITGEARWGPQKGPAWTPEGWDEGLLHMDAEQLKRDAAAVSQDRDAAQRREIALERDIAADQEFIDKLDERKQSLSKAEADQESLTKHRDDLERELSAMPNPSGDSGAACPSCGTQLTPVVDGEGFLTLQVFEAPADKGEYDRALKARKAKKAELDAVRSKLSSDYMRIHAIKGMIKTGEECAKTIDAKRQDLEALKAGMADLMERAVALTQRARATELHRLAAAKNREIEMGMKTVDVLKPEGIRRRVLMTKMEKFNSLLANISATAGWGVVKVDGNFCLRMDGRHYATLSGAQQMASDITVQVAVARETKAAAVVIDAVDAFDSAWRNKLLTMLSKCRMTSMVGLWMNKAAKTPDLQKAGMGHTYWVEKGEVRLLSEVLEA